MTNFIQFISNNSLLFLIIFVAIVFLVWNLSLHWQIWQTRKKIKLMFKGTKVADLEDVIFEQIKRSRQIEKNLENLEKFSQQVEKMALNSIQKIGVVRFNPFKDTGGDQSFCIAFLDAQNNGFTLSSLFTREGARIYTKPITQGVSTYPLTEEEKDSIKKAIEAKPKISSTKSHDK